MHSDIDRGIAELALRQHGLFTFLQVLQLGGNHELIRRRVRAGRWICVGVGVYALPGVRPTWRRSLMLSLLEAGPDTAVAVHAAGALHRLDSFPPCTPILVSPHGDHHKIRSAVVRQTRALPPEHVTVVDGIRTTTIARTIWDLGAHLTRKRLEHVLDDTVAAGRLKLPEIRGVHDVLAKRGRPGTGRMRSVLADRSPGWVPPDSVMERMFLDILAARHISLPLKQRPFPGRETLRHRVDFCDVGPGPINIFETDGRRWHMRVADFERDRKRDREAHLAGCIVYRFTYFELRDEPDEVAQTVVDARRIANIRWAS